MGVVVVLAVVAVAVVTALAVAVALPWRVSLALSARGAKGGGWALAGGAQLAAVAATYTRGRGVPGAVGVPFGRALLELHGFGFHSSSLVFLPCM